MMELQFLINILSCRPILYFREWGKFLNLFLGAKFSITIEIAISKFWHCTIHSMLRNWKVKLYSVIEFCTLAIESKPRQMICNSFLLTVCF